MLDWIALAVLELCWSWLTIPKCGLNLDRLLLVADRLHTIQVGYRSIIIMTTTNNNSVPIHRATELERLAPGTWVIYQGTESGWVTAWGVWPVFPPPNRVWHSWPQGVPSWRPRVQYDGPPGYDWEDYRDYIDRWGLPEHFQNNRRNGVVNHHGNINSELEKVD